MFFHCIYVLLTEPNLYTAAHCTSSFCKKQQPSSEILQLYLDHQRLVLSLVESGDVRPLLKRGAQSQEATTWAAGTSQHGVGVDLCIVLVGFTRQKGGIETYVAVILGSDGMESLIVVLH